jgi:hypothetical protein
VRSKEEVVKWAITHHLRNVSTQYLGGFFLRLEKRQGMTNLEVQIRMARVIPSKWSTYANMGDDSG